MQKKCAEALTRSSTAWAYGSACYIAEAMCERGPLCFHVFTCVLWFPKLGGLGFSPYQSKGGRESRRIKIIAKHLPFTCHAREPHESLVIGVTTRRPVPEANIILWGWKGGRVQVQAYVIWINHDQPNKRNKTHPVAFSLHLSQLSLR